MLLRSDEAIVIGGSANDPMAKVVLLRKVLREVFIIQNTKTIWIVIGTSQLIKVWVAKSGLCHNLPYATMQRPKRKLFLPTVASDWRVNLPELDLIFLISISGKCLLLRDMILNFEQNIFNGIIHKPTVFNGPLRVSYPLM